MAFEDEETKTSPFQQWVDKNSKRGTFGDDEDEDEHPRTLEIRYSRSTGDDIELPPAQVEVVFEDQDEGEHRRPRLLVSLQSVTALKQLCEREFARVEVLSGRIDSCRKAYFKELLYLREQLVLAGRPEAQACWDYVMSYEVYWYDPPAYVDAELKEFMLNCNRITNKALIEEIYNLKQSGAVKSAPAPSSDDDAEVRRLLKKLGPAKLLKRIWGTLGTKEHGSPELRDELFEAVKELFGERLAPPRREEPVAKNTGPSKGELDKLRKEIEDLHKQLEAMENLRRMYKELQHELEDVKKLAAAEKARADAERERAEAEKLRADNALAELAKPPPPTTGSDKSAELALRQASDRAAGAVSKATAVLAKKMNVAVPKAAVLPSASKLDGAVSTLEALSTQEVKVEPKTVEVIKERVISTGSDGKEVKRLEERISELEAQLEAAKQEVKKAKQESDSWKRRVAELEGRPVAEALPPPEFDTSSFDAEIASLKKARKDALKKAEESEQREEVLKQQLDRLKEEMRRLENRAPKTIIADDGSKQRVEQLEEELEAMAMRLTRAQDKIAQLKEELRKYKRMAGEEVNSDDESDDDFEGDIPSFLIAYFRRIKNSPKPRWQLLSEDAKLAVKKREWLFTQKVRIMEPAMKPALLSSEATAAFNFLKRKEDQDRLGRLPPPPQPPIGRQKRTRDTASLDEARKMLSLPGAGHAEPFTAEAAALAAVQAYAFEEALAGRQAQPLFVPAAADVVGDSYMMYLAAEASSEGILQMGGPPPPSHIASAAASAASAAAAAASSRQMRALTRPERIGSPTKSLSPERPGSLGQSLPRSPMQGSRVPSPSAARSPHPVVGLAVHVAALQGLTSEHSKVGSPFKQSGGQAGVAGGPVTSSSAMPSAEVLAAARAVATGGSVSAVSSPSALVADSDGSRMPLSQGRAPPPGWLPACAIDTAERDFTSASPSSRPSDQTKSTHIVTGQTHSPHPLLVGAGQRSSPTRTQPPFSPEQLHCPSATSLKSSSSPGLSAPQHVEEHLAHRNESAESASPQDAGRLMGSSAVTSSGVGIAPAVVGRATASDQSSSHAREDSAGQFNAGTSTSSSWVSSPIRNTTMGSLSTTCGGSFNASVIGPGIVSRAGSNPQTSTSRRKSMGKVSLVGAASGNSAVFKPALGQEVTPQPGRFGSHTLSSQSWPSPPSQANPQPPEGGGSAGMGVTSAPLRQMVAPGPRVEHVVVSAGGRSQSTGALPLTNAGKAAARLLSPSQSPTKLPRRSPAVAGAAEGNAESLLPEVLPPMPRGRIRKQPSPSWLVAV
eukprot:TRINITY_DN40013_c0_g1_i1.p1 TRINITY_DN40013_c0_g1~~TRINITY_DN40013_c0_g1_i1.p1  ORF type:complete len:1300 (-),score=241.87 TRINITY_DN40013_c0_g1_i1:326-4225(-)